MPTRPVGGMRPDPGMITPPMSRRGTEDVTAASASPSIKPGVPIRKHSQSHHGKYVNEGRDRDSYAVTPYDSRQQMFIDEEERATQRSQYQSTAEYPQPTSPRHPPNAIRTYPPVSQSWISSAGRAPMSGLSDTQLKMLIDSGALKGGQRGHKFGGIYLDGSGSALCGNAYVDPLLAPLGKVHDFGTIRAGKKWNGVFLGGDQHVSLVENVFDGVRKQNMGSRGAHGPMYVDEEEEDFS
ncbi:hypothetical protein LTR64_003000 [Lithohypha guttulata]|uniref:uncharacterized protein n=1 Tax=Lithohypha guttulata TaxID=1690604 RepID=UPI002DDE4728|nr:hypothetical protein LTR51_000776 [Lithohypha guttulata]